MLQSVSSSHDNHYVRSQSSSIESLVAARNDGKKHLLLAYVLLLLGSPPSRPCRPPLKLTADCSASGSVATIKSKSRSLNIFNSSLA